MGDGSFDAEAETARLLRWEMDHLIQKLKQLGCYDGRKDRLHRQWFAL